VLRTRILLALAIATLTFFVSAHALLQLPSIPDTDSYYHLAVARLYGEQGVVDRLEWARFSVMRDGFGDKEPLFHALLIPFASATGGRLAVAAVNAFLAGVVTFIATGAMGVWGASIAPLLFLTAPWFWSRTIRLRPEALSVTLMILVIYAAARRRPLLAGLFAMTFALTHTPWHALAGLAVLWLVVTRLREKIWEWRTPAAILGGIVLGLVIHPHFPFNLKIWFLQNVVSIQRGVVIGMSTENVRPPIHLLLAHNAGWFLAAAAALLLVRPWREKASREAIFFAIPAFVFTAMQLLWERMSTYFFPIATLAIVLWCGTRLTRRSLIAIALVALAASAAFNVRSAQRLAAQLPQNVEHDWEELGKLIPAGAKIAATWGATDAYVFWAPQGRYLNVLDPAMMLEKNPAAYWAHRAILDGTEPNAPHIARTLLDSDYIAFPKWEATPLLTARIAHDPRLVPMYDGYNVLLRIQPTNAFITDWPGHPPFPDFITAPATQCTTFTRMLDRGRYELAPWGPTRVWLDERLLAETKTAPLAILGRGRIIDVDAAAEMKVETCGAGGRAGFYLVRR
jgi:hypothetical protein